MNYINTQILKTNYKPIKKYPTYYIGHILPKEEEEYINCIEFMSTSEITEEDLEFYELDYKENMFKILKENMLRDIEEYDSSDNVNGFILNGQVMWLNKADRVGLMNSTTIQKESGLENTTLWYNNISYTLPIDKMLQLLQALELYALECYNVTANHKAQVNNMTSYDEIINYDYRTGYPDMIKINI